jgi:hypothetical protein
MTDIKELLKRLRRGFDHPLKIDEVNLACDEAADEIVRLQVDLSKMTMGRDAAVDEVNRQTARAEAAEARLAELVHMGTQRGIGKRKSS